MSNSDSPAYPQPHTPASPGPAVPGSAGPGLAGPGSAGPRSAGPGSARARRGGFVRDFVTGVGFLLRGLGTYTRSPGMMLLGVIPAIITVTLLVLSFVGMFRFWAPDLAEMATPFAEGWAEGPRDTVRVLATGAILLVWVVLSILIFTALTLTVGQPFYEAISKKVEDRLGGVPGEINVSFWKTLPRSIFDSLRLVVFALFVAVFVLLIGVIPIIGQVSAAVLGALLGGWLLAVEITSVPFERRGLKLRDRRRTLKSRRGMSLGFGVATFVCFLVPLGAVLMMPAAVAGGTLLSRRLFGQPDAT